MQFDTLNDYLGTCGSSEDLALLPVPLVAEHLGVTPAAVTARMGRGALEEIRIGKSRFVSRRSLLAERDLREQRADRVEPFLLDLASRGERKIYYEPVMKLVGLSWRVPADRTEIGRILAVVSRRSLEKSGAMISVLVHKKTAGTTLPSGAFFELAENLGFDWEDDYDFVEEQTDRVIAHASRIVQPAG
ncbi:hypothetical protein [Sagittula sp. MA-2]|jgi:hypothetical protein|uniref:hypothetical protein n=1 Tax=Sagittula sp. MA-2 TaxID=3048007 RepID=UPI0024C33DC2|nr:hypothetical protein [Sagittula sp. MA-2]WHZ36516.1 hypothetical protein QNI11_05760 [Sagittula sp. MA-2]